MQGVMTKKPSQAQASCGKDGSGNVVVVVVVVGVSCSMCIIVQSSLQARKG